jgi:formiminoglutamate deiminase
MTAYLCESAWLGGADAAGDVLVEVADGRIASVHPAYDGPLPDGTTTLRGLVVPGLANAHSHAFHRALRARTEQGKGTFWTWRERMYGVAEALDPDRYLALARATFAEMALAGVTTVGEFHYVHHGPGGVPYDDPNAMGGAVVAAAAAAGVRLTLLDTCYLTGGVGRTLEGTQLRFGDGDAARWAERVDALRADLGDPAGVRVGAAVHSVRGVPPDQVPAVAGWALAHDAPLHVHLSEQVAENEACLAAFGRTPTEVLHDAGALGPTTTVVHATHVAEHDRTLLGAAETTACLCPTTERDLADGIGPAAALRDAGCALALGSDSQSVVDLLEEARGIEAHERLASQQRGHFAAGELLAAAANHACLGWSDVGRIATGQRADLVALDTRSVRTAGGAVGAALAVFAATAADVTDVVVDGRPVVRDRRHLLVDDVPRALADAVAAVTW